MARNSLIDTYIENVHKVTGRPIRLTAGTRKAVQMRLVILKNKFCKTDTEFMACINDVFQVNPLNSSSLSFYADIDNLASGVYALLSKTNTCRSLASDDDDYSGAYVNR